MDAIFKNTRSIIWQTLSHSLSDENFLKLKYFFLYKHFPDLENPKLFSEKIIWRMLYEQRPIFQQISDKVALHDYIKDKGLERFLPQRYFVSQDIDSVDFNSLPNTFVIKPSHTSGRIHVVYDKATENWRDVLKLCKVWLKTDYYRVNREWQYKHMPRNIIIEEYLGIGHKIPSDYKIHCFHGEPHWISVISGRFSKKMTISRYDKNWLSVGREDTLLSTDEARPENLGEMLNAARLFSEGFDYLRVDLFLLDDQKIVLGELTPTPKAGIGWRSDEMLENLGEFWRLDISKKTIRN